MNDDEYLEPEEAGIDGSEVTCPKCGTVTLMPGGWAMVDLYVCPGCREMVAPFPLTEQ